MDQRNTLLFYEPITPKQYLDTVLSAYPYDIDPSLVYTLLTKTPYPHPSLLTFIDFIRCSEKYLIAKDEQEPKLSQLYTTMCALSQRNAAVLHTHQFHFDCILHTAHCPFAHPYTYLPYDKIAMIDHILINRRTQITLPKQKSMPIHYDECFPFHSLSIDPKHYLALSIQASQLQGLILLPKKLACYITAISSLYSINPKPTQHDFLLLYGIQMPNTQNVITYDRNYHQLIGCSMKEHENSYSLNECLEMLEALISIIKLKQQDLALSAAMLKLTLNETEYGMLICSDSNQQQSSFSDACLSFFQHHAYPQKAIFENYGILHLLDDAIYATGVQIGSYIHTSSLSKESILEKLTAAVLINEHNKNTHMIMPLTTYEKSCSFHKVHILCILEQSSNTNISIIHSLKDLEQYKWKHKFINHNLNEQFDALWKNICKTLFLNNTLILKISLSKKKAASAHQLKKLLEQIVQLISEQK